MELYGLFGVEVFRLEEELGFLFGAAQELFGEGWSVVGPVGLSTHEVDLAVETLFSEGLGGRATGYTRSNYYVELIFVPFRHACNRIFVEEV